MPLMSKCKAVRMVMGLTIIFLVIELLDELVGGVLVAAWPLIRHDLQLSYIQVGIVLTIPKLVASVIEPFLGIWADIGQRRQLILAGGIGFAIALVLIAFSQNFALLLTAFVLLGPTSGSFANVSQATLMDLEPARHEQNMARWTLAGSLGSVMGPLILAGAIALHQTWRGAFFILAILIGLLPVLLWKSQTSFAAASDDNQLISSFMPGIYNTIAALKRSTVLCWLILLQFSDLMLDVLRGFVALYFVDVVGVNTTEVSLAIGVWIGFGLLGDFLLIPLLERVRGLAYLRVSTGLVLCLYPTFLVVPNLVIKFILLGCLGFLNAGWYSILKGQLYTAMPGQSGTVITLSKVFGFFGSLAPLGLGLMAQQMGLESAMWVLVAAPIALLIGLLW